MSKHAKPIWCYYVWNYTELKAVPLQTRQAHRGGRGIVPPSNDPNARRGWVVSATPLPLYPKERDRVSIVKKRSRRKPFYKTQMFYHTSIKLQSTLNFILKYVYNRYYNQQLSIWKLYICLCVSGLLIYAVLYLYTPLTVILKFLDNRPKRPKRLAG